MPTDAVARVLGSGAAGARDAAGEPIELRRGACGVIAAPPLAAELVRQGLLERGGLSRLLGRAEPGPAGRVRTGWIALPGAGRLHLRPLRHGGALARLWAGRMLGLGRPRRELWTGARLLAAGAPVARPAFVAGERRLGLWRAVLATRAEPRTRDAATFLAATSDPARVLRAAAAAGRALRRFHDAGGRHPDLHAGNLLLRETPSGVEAVVIDLDRARCGAPPGPRARLAELVRLHRSLEKRRLAGRVGDRGRAAFLRAYTGGDRKLRGALLRGLPRERRRLARHRLGYRLAARLAARSA